MRPENHHFLLHAAADPHFPNECPGTHNTPGGGIHFETREFKDNGISAAFIVQKAKRKICAKMLNLFLFQQVSRLHEM
jgi:hypothetical protein